METEPQVPFGTLRPEERRALTSVAFAAGCICLMPGEIVGALISFALAGILGAFHLVRSRREQKTVDK